jgi:hypothetical protein
VRLAAQGLRDMDEGVERVRDPDDLRAQRRQAVRVHLSAAAIATLLTSVVVWIA